MGKGRSIQKDVFGTTREGETVERYLIRNGRGMEVCVISYGAILQALRVPDREGRFDDIVLGFDSLDEYFNPNPYFGAIIGRYANRIGDARFSLNGTTYSLQANNGPNHLHGGIKGFDKYVWGARPIETPERVGVMLTRVSADGEEGYPGEVHASVTYLLDDHNALAVVFEGTTTAPTHLNLTQHTYFNLSTANRILDHLVMIQADRFVAVNENLIPTGELPTVDGTPLDFRTPTPVGAHIDDLHFDQIARAGGYDHTYVLRRPHMESDVLVHAARVQDPASGRTLDVYTTEPGMQFYSGNFLDGTMTGKGGKPYLKRAGFCLETQHFPDTPNRPEFPSTRLDPGQVYRSRTEFRFSVEDAD